MRTRTAEDLVLDVRQRADMVGSDFVSDDEILEYINQEAAELRGVIRRAEGQPHTRSTHTFTVTSGTETYALPGDFAELLSVKRTYGGREFSLKPFMEFERAHYTDPALSAAPAAYRLNGDNIDFLPSTADCEITIAYISGESRLQFSPGSPNTLDGVQGYEIACVYGATATVLQKEESDPSFYLGQKERILNHIRSMAAHRDGGQPERVTDVVGWNPWDI
jgi:hypothetical protein